MPHRHHPPTSDNRAVDRCVPAFREYAMMKAAVERGWPTVRHARADIILTYYAAGGGQVDGGREVRAVAGWMRRRLLM
jgi:hypothetical protein